MKNKLLSFMMVFALIFNIFPVCVYAETIREKIGENAYFEYDTATKILRIYGSGEYDAFRSIAKRLTETRSIRNDMELLIFDEGITYVPSITFSMSLSLKEIQLADSVETIEKEAFYGSESLEKVVGGNGLKYIKDCAFSKCKNLCNVSIPKDVNIANDAFDGCTKLVINRTEYSNNQLIRNELDDKQILYAADGRSAIFKKSDVAAQLTVGWYKEPVQTLYAADGRSKVFKKSQVATQLTVGWYEEPVVYMYALDGRIRITKKSEIEAYEKVNWYYGKPTKIYAADGRIKTIGEKRVEEYKKVGWYTEPIGSNSVETTTSNFVTEAFDVKNSVACVNSALEHVNTAITYLKKIELFGNEIIGNSYLKSVKNELGQAKNDLRSASTILKKYDCFSNLIENLELAIIVLEVSESTISGSKNAYASKLSIVKNLGSFLNYITKFTSELSSLGYKL